MADKRAETGDAAAAWSSYWQGTQEAAAYRKGGPQDEVLASFWSGLIGRICANGVRWRMLDFACGNGVVTQLALTAAHARDEKVAPEFVGLDASLPAASAYRARFPSASAVVAHGRRTPFADAAFDLVASQFGLEYAGLAALGEAARLVKPGGLLAAVMHMRHGALYRECESNFAAIARVRDSAVLAAAKEVFRRGASARRGLGSRAEFGRADARLAVAVKELENVLGSFGEAVAGGTVLRLYQDLAHMYGRMDAYDAGEVAAWADRLAGEIDSYAQRMSAVLDVALDAAQLDAAAALAASCGLAVRLREELRMGPGIGEPAAWVLVCERPHETALSPS